MDILIQSVKDTLHFAPRLVVIFVALLVTELLLQFGILKKLEFMGRPLVKLAHLPHESVISFITAFGSPLAANTMLAKLVQEAIISTKEAFLSAMLNGIPTYIKETFTYQFAVIMPALGPKIGTVYLVTFLLAGVVKSAFVILVGRTTLKKKGKLEKVPVYEDCERPIFKTILPNAFKKQTRIFCRISLIFILVTFIVAGLINSGSIEAVKKYISPITRALNLPEEAVIPITTFALSPLVGASGIGALLQTGKITEKEGIIIALLGGLLALPVYALRHSLAYYASIFGFRLGMTILITSIGIGMFVRGTVLLLFLLII